MGAGHEVHAVTHLGLEEDHRGLAAALAGLSQFEGLLDGIEVMAFGDDDVPVPGRPLGGEVTFTGYLGDGAVDLLAVPVGHGDEVVQLVEHGEHAGFPNLAFLGFAVTAQAIDEVVVLVQLLAEGETAGGGQALAQGTGGLEDAGEFPPHGGMALEAGTVGTESGEFAHRKITGTGEDGVIHRGHVTGGKDEHVLSFAVPGPCGWILFHDVEIQGGENVCR